MASGTHDAVILGGGLAGLTLAMQLRGQFPDMDIVVLERRSHPLPVAAHKVGESTVEIAAHYFGETLGLREHLERAHIRKFGFRFFFSEGREDLGKVTELGVSKVLPTPSFQIDRGIFENFLGEEALRRGIDFRDESVVRGFEIGQGGAAHSVRYTDTGGAEHTLTSRWLLDASGRAGLIRRRYDLTRDNGHHANAVWFRIDDRLEIDGWCDDAQWQSRCDAAGALALDQSPVRPRLLAVADPAGFRRAFGRHRRRRGDASDRNHARLRQGPGLDGRTPAGGGA